MQRPPIASSRRAVNSLAGRSSSSPTHVWISDELLALTASRFFRVECADQRRHGSHVPGPLEARKRGVKRNMGLQAHLPPPGIPASLFDLKALFTRRPSPETSWRYEPPSAPAFAPPCSEPISTYGTPSYESVASDGAGEPPTSPAPTSSNAQAIQECSPRDTSATPSPEAVAGTAETTPTPLNQPSEAPESLLNARTSNAPTEERAAPAFLAITIIKRAVWTELGPKTRRMSTADISVKASAVKKTFKMLRDLGDKFVRADNLKDVRAFVETYVSLASTLEKARLVALEALCRRGYYLYEGSAETQDASKNEKAAQFTALVLEVLLTRDWPMDTIYRWLGEPHVVLPSFSTYLESLVTRRKAKPLDSGELRSKVMAESSEGNAKWAQTKGAAQNLRRVEQLLYRAEWARFVHQHAPSLERKEVRKLCLVADTLIDAITQERPMQVSVNDHVIDLLNCTRDPSPKSSNVGKVVDVRRVFDKYILPLLQVNTGSSSMDEQENVGMPILLAHNAPVRLSTITSGADELDSMVKLLKAISASTIEVHSVKQTAPLSRTWQRDRVTQWAAKDAESDAQMHLFKTTQQYLPIMEFQSILGLALDARVLPLRYQSASAAQLMPHREKIIHQLAYQYSIDTARSLHQNQRSLGRLREYLYDEGLRFGPLFSRSMVHLFITRPMLEDDFVSAKTALWVADLVRQVEGDRVARSLMAIFSSWKGEAITAAKQRFLELGFEGKARIKTFKRVGVPLWREA